MKQSEKLDLLLRGFYKYKYDGNPYELSKVTEENKIPISNFDELYVLSKRLHDDGLISAIFFGGDGFAEITSRGIEYCEGDSYTYKSSPVITNNYSISVSNSTGVSLVNQSKDVNVNMAISTVTHKISELKSEIEKSEEIPKINKNDMLDCLDEISILVESGKKPKYAFRSLVELTSQYAGIGSLVLELGKLLLH